MKTLASTERYLVWEGVKGELVNYHLLEVVWGRVILEWVSLLVETAPAL